MGIRKEALIAIKEALNGLEIWAGVNLVAVNHLFDPLAALKAQQLPKISVVPNPHTIIVGMMGSTGDHSMQIMLYGYVASRVNEDLALVAEDLIEKVEQALRDPDNVAEFGCDGVGFSITQIGPILSEEYPIQHPLAFISMPVSIVFIEDVT